MKKIIVVLILFVLSIVADRLGLPLEQLFNSAVVTEDNRLEDAYANQQSDIQVRGQGTVVKLLSDDLKGSRHQKFILKLDGSKLTILIAHNIDLAPRIPNLATGDKVEFFGEYEWNKKGGVIHWTHDDPAGRHPDGWLRHQGNFYQ